jgi:uncharacterized membrane protein
VVYGNQPYVGQPASQRAREQLYSIRITVHHNSETCREFSAAELYIRLTFAHLHRTSVAARADFRAIGGCSVRKPQNWRFESMLLAARILHIVLGVFWVGTMLFNTFLLMPAMAEAGPDGAKVGSALMRRGFATLMPMVAALTLLSGLWLYWSVVGFSPTALGSGRGLTFGLGGLSAIVAFFLGIVGVRPAMLRSMALAQAAATAPETDRPGLNAAATALRARAARLSTLVAFLLLFTTIAMSIGRYI